MIKWQTKTGKEVQMWIETERESIGDHTVMVPCYDLKIEIDGIGDIGPVELDGHIFRETITRTIGGKVVKLAFPACEKAEVLYREYRAEIAHRIDRKLKNDLEYEAHYNRVVAAMAE